MIRKLDVAKLIPKLEALTHGLPQPMCTVLAQQYHHDPFIILIACLLSLRSRDVVTMPIVQNLLKKAKTPQAFLKLSNKELESLIYSVGFYKRKAKILKAVSNDILNGFNGKVPDNEADLLSLPGVGRKTANIVLSEAFGKPAIAVDVHVHRLSNQLGLVKTKTPEETERALMKVVPKKYWRSINRLLVTCGQHNCDFSKLNA